MKKYLLALAFIFLAAPCFAQGTKGTGNIITINGLLPSQVGKSGQFLSTNGTNVLWSTTSGGGGGSLAITATSANASFFPLFATSTSASATTVFVDTASPWNYNPSTGLSGILGLTTTALTVNGNAALSGTTTISTARIVGGTINGTTIGATTSSTALFSTATISTLNVTTTCNGCTNPVLLPLSVTTTDTAGNEFPYTYFDSTSTGAAALGSPGWGTAASLGADTSLRYRFMMPPTIPTIGTINLCTVCQANATSGVVKYTVTDADIATNNTQSVGGTVLNSETQTSITWSAADDYVTTCTPLTAVPAANHILAGAITFNHTSWTLAQILSCNAIVRWQ